MKKISLLLVMCLILSMSVVMSGCSSGGKLYLYVNDDSLKATYTKLAQSFVSEYNADENNKKIEIIVKSTSGTDYIKGLKDALAQEKEYPSVFVLNGINDYNAVKDSCADLSDTDLYKQELLVKSLAVTENEKVKAIPVSVDGFGLIYNESIMQKYFSLSERATTVKSVAEINSYDIFVQVIEDIQRHTEELGVKGAAAPIPLRMNYRDDAQKKLIGIPLYYELEESADAADASTDKNITFKYSENLKNTLDLFVNNTYISATVLGNITYVDAAVDFAQKKSAIMMGTTSAWKYISTAENNSVTKDDISFMPLYMGIKEEKNHSIAMGASSYVAVNSKLNEKETALAKQFINWLYTDKDCITEFNCSLSLPFKSAAGDNPLTDKVMEYAQGSVPTVPFEDDRYPSAEFNDIMGESLLDYVQGIYSWDGIMATATDAWQK